MRRYTPSECSRNHGDEEQFVRAHALLIVARNLVMDAAKEVKGYFCLTPEVKQLARRIEEMARQLDSKYSERSNCGEDEP